MTAATARAMRLYDTARQEIVPFEPGPIVTHVHVRHHAVRRHAPRPRRRLPHLRRAAAPPARPRPRDPLRAQHHRRRRRDPAQGPRARRALPRPGRGRDGPVRRRHGAPSTCCRLVSEPRATSAIADIRGFIGMVLDRATPTRRAASVYFDVSTFPRFGQISHYDREQMLDLAAERGGNVDDPNKRDPLDFVLWQPSARRRAGVGVAVGAGPAGLAHRVLGAGAARARHHHRPPRRRQPT